MGSQQRVKCAQEPGARTPIGGIIKTINGNTGGRINNIMFHQSMIYLICLGNIFISWQVNIFIVEKNAVSFILILSYFGIMSKRILMFPILLGWWGEYVVLRTPNTFISRICKIPIHPFNTKPTTIILITIYGNQWN